MELKRIESLQPKKFSRYYIDRFCTILNQSNLKNNMKYFIQRKNLKYNMKKDPEEKDDLYITSQNFEEKNDDYENDNNDIYPEYLLYENNEGILTNNYDDEREKMLYEKLKTKENFNNRRSYNNINNKNKISSLKENETILKRKYNLSPNFIKNFDPNLAKAIENNKINKITENQAKNLYYISDLNIFKSIDVINDKKEKLKKIKHQKNKYLNNINLFNYDSKKWNEKRKELNKNINEIMFNRFNTENSKYLNNMRKGINKTSENATNIENNLNIFFDEIDDFIDKQVEYIKENNPQSNSESRNFSKRNSLRRRSRIKIEKSKEKV
jgi:hypothetical protein